MNEKQHPMNLRYAELMLFNIIVKWGKKHCWWLNLILCFLEGYLWYFSTEIHIENHFRYSINSLVFHSSTKKRLVFFFLSLPWFNNTLYTLTLVLSNKISLFNLIMIPWISYKICFVSDVTSILYIYIFFLDIAV